MAMNFPDKRSSIKKACVILAEGETEDAELVKDLTVGIVMILS